MAGQEVIYDPNEKKTTVRKTKTEADLSAVREDERQKKAHSGLQGLIATAKAKKSKNEIQREAVAGAMKGEK